CTKNVNLCDPAVAGVDGGLSGQNYNFFAVPSQPKVNQVVDIFIVTQKDVTAAAIWVSEGGCLGHTAPQPCDTPGDGCPGWNVVRVELVPKMTGSHTIELTINEAPNMPCTTSAVGSWKFDVQP